MKYRATIRVRVRVRAGAAELPLRALVRVSKFVNFPDLVLRDEAPSRLAVAGRRLREGAVVLCRVESRACDTGRGADRTGREGVGGRRRKRRARGGLG